MNGEVDYEKVLEIEFHGTTYIMTVKADDEGMLLELEDKFLGTLWQSFYQPQYIEQITSKTGNLKRYNVFTKMLITALTGSSDSVHVDVLTHQDLEMQASRKNGAASKTTDPKLINKRYLIMSYMAEFDKVHYPLPLDYVSNPDPERLKLTIRRLSQQLQCYRDETSNPRPESFIKQLSAIKYQNQLLKSKVRSLMKNDSKENLNNNSLSKEIQQENKNLKQQLAKLKSSKEQQIGKKNKIIEEKQAKIEDLQTKLTKREENNKNYEIYEEKFNKLSKDATELASALQHSRQNEKKSQLKIANLEKELQKMMGQMKRTQHTTSNRNILNSPRKSDAGSVKSSGSVNSINKNKVSNKSSKKIIPTQRKSSVYDSDTESSRMRNIGRSPYRQSSRPLNSSKSAKKKQSERANAISKYSNISNLYNKERTNRGRSRSKSRSVKKQPSPPSDNFESSAIMTEDREFLSDEEEDNKNSTLQRLRNRKKNQNILPQNINKEKKNSLNPIQQKISSIASLMRNLRNNANTVQSGNQN